MIPLGEKAFNGSWHPKGKTKPKQKQTGKEKPKATRLGGDFGLGLAAAFEVCPDGPCRQS